MKHVATHYSSKVVKGRGTNDAIKGCGAEQDKALLKRLRDEVHYDYFNPPIILPYETHLAILEFLRSTCYRNLSYDAGYELLGYLQWKTHLEGVIGKASGMAARLMGPERATKLFVNGMSVGLPFGKHVMEEYHKGYARYHQYGISDPPAFTRGTIRAGLETAGARRIKIISKQIAPLENIFEATWG